MSDGPRPFNYRRLFWTWHLYAGLLGTPLLILISLTGAILVFSPEIDAWLRPDLWHIQPAESAGQARVSDQAMLDSVATKFPKSKIILYRQGLDDSQPYQFLMTTPGVLGLHDVWVNPYTGAIIGERPRESAFVRIAEQLHRRLLAGEPGSMVMEFITGWLVILCLTGIYLWWPKTLRQLRLGLTLPMKGGVYKVNWRLHNTIGAWSSVAILLMALTGMVITPFAGRIYNWVASKIDSGMNLVAQPPKSEPVEGASSAPIDNMLAQARAGGPEGLHFMVQIPRDKTGSYVLSTLRHLRHGWNDQQHFKMWAFDQYSGRELAQASWGELPTMFRFRVICLSIHYGSIFGLPTKFIALGGCLAVPVLAITGCLIWWLKRSRRNSPASGAVGERPSQLIAHEPVSPLVVVVLGALFVILPTIGVSFLVVTGWEWMRGRVRTA